LIAGLGNPGDRYAGTRHNIGFEVVDRVCRELNASAGPDADLYQWSVAELPAGKIYLAKPGTSVNRAGLAVHQLLADSSLEISRLLVVLDDFQLPLGAVRIRAFGSDGGHNGLASIIDELGTQDFARLRLGIGPPQDTSPATDFVLARFEPEEEETVEEMVAIASQAVIFAAGHPLDEVMSKYNKSPAPPNGTRQ